MLHNAGAILHSLEPASKVVLYDASMSTCGAAHIQAAHTWSSSSFRKRCTKGAHFCRRSRSRSSRSARPACTWAHPIWAVLLFYYTASKLCAWQAIQESS